MQASAFFFFGKGVGFSYYIKIDSLVQLITSYIILVYLSEPHMHLNQEIKSSYLLGLCLVF